MTLAGTASTDHPHYFALVAIALLVFAGYVLYAYLKAHDHLPRQQTRASAPTFLRDPYARAADIRRLLATKPTPGRITYARVDDRRYLQTRDGESLLVIGGAGSGKTNGVLAPAVRAWVGPAVVVATKADIVAETEFSRPHAFLVQPGATDSTLPILGWSPLDAIRDALQAHGPDAGWAESVRTADAMTAGGPEHAGDGFATVAAAQALAPLLHAAAVTSSADMGDVLAWVKRSEFSTPLTMLQEHALVEQATFALTGLVNKDPRTRSRIMTNLDAAIHAYDDPQVLAATTTRGRFRPAMLLDPAYPTSTLYVLSDPLTQARTAPFYRALLDEVTRVWCQRAAGHAATRLPVPPEQRLLLIFDDAVDIAALPHLDELASHGGDHGVAIALGLRDLAPLRTGLGEQIADAVVRSCRTRVITSGMSDAPTLKLVNDLIGPADVAPTALTTEAAPPSTARREVLTVAELRGLDPGQAVVVTGAEPPIRARLLDRSDFAAASDGETVAAVGPYPSPLPERRWPFQAR